MHAHRLYFFFDKFLRSLGYFIVPHSRKSSSPSSSSSSSIIISSIFIAVRNIDCLNDFAIIFVIVL